jgi:hypothetical protein
MVKVVEAWPGLSAERRTAIVELATGKPARHNGLTDC